MSKKIRVMWLLNHTTLREFEIAQIRAMGIDEIFLPKSFPYDEGNMSASVDDSLDQYLTIPVDELAILNEQNWYDSPSQQAWDIANKYFDVAFIAFFPRQIKSAASYFKGDIILRVFGREANHTYTQRLNDQLGSHFLNKLNRISHRLWFGAGYEHLKDIEGPLLKKINCYLPVGLKGELSVDNWQGSDKKILFVCPRIKTSPYYTQIYQDFKNNFKGLEYVIGGAQPIKVNDERVLGFTPKEIHQKNMRDLRVMFYHSTEPNHIHYHPFEAIRVGMPLVFMGGGMLDRFGGIGLPGRCKNNKEARLKIERILNDDWKLINNIRDSQLCLFEPIREKTCIPAWQATFTKILQNVDERKTAPQLPVQNKKSKIAILLPFGYKGGSLRGAKLLAEAIYLGSLQAGNEVEVIFGHVDDPNLYQEEEFNDLPQAIKRRSFKWLTLNKERAIRAMTYGRNDFPLNRETYQVPDDGINHFMDCDLWVIVSDRLTEPVLPLRPYILMVYDYLQRYMLDLPAHVNQKYLQAANNAERVIVTTQFTKDDAHQFAGLDEHKVVKLPMLVPDFSKNIMNNISEKREKYFIWTTNLAFHKNHENSMKALRIYYEELEGTLECYVTGYGTDAILLLDYPHLAPVKKIISKSKDIKQKVKFMGELPDKFYQSTLSTSNFLWHTAQIDNGTFSVIEAAHFGVPALSSDYPPMREIDTQFGLNLTWMDPNNPLEMARRLKEMEIKTQEGCKFPLTNEKINTQSVKDLALNYWDAVRECL